MTETKEGAISLWIREMMVNEAITICPRCCVNLVCKDPYEYLTGKGIAEGRAADICFELVSLGINKGYHLYADCMDHDGKYNYEEGTEFYLCSACAEGGVDWHEKSEEWPIEGRG